jgi:hypothetical protein
MFYSGENFINERLFFFNERLLFRRNRLTDFAENIYYLIAPDYLVGNFY